MSCATVSATVTTEQLIDALEERLQRLAQDLESASEALRRGDAATTATTAVNPAVLLGRVLRLRRDALPVLRQEAERVVAAKQELVETMRTVAMANRRELLALQTTAGVPQLPATGPLASFLQAAAEWDRVSGLAARAQEALTLQLVQTAAPTTAAQTAATTSATLQTSLQPSPSTTSSSVIVPIPRQQRSATRFVPIDEEEFERVSSTVRGRAKLVDVNKIYRVVFDNSSQGGTPMTAAALNAQGCKATGLSGECAISTLRSLHVIDVSKQGIVIAGSKRK